MRDYDAVRQAWTAFCWLWPKDAACTLNETDLHACGLHRLWRQFSGAMWVQPTEDSRFKTEELLQGRFSGRINPVGELPSIILQALIDCALHSDDISGLQAKAIQG